MNIYFGSQTGTSEGFARTIMEEAKNHGFHATVIDLEDFNEDILAKSTLSLFLMATYGEGEPTDNASNFISWLKEKTDDSNIDNNYTFLSELKYCVFGLGNRQYEHFNRMGLLVDELLSKLSAKRLITIGLGDDDGSLEDDFDKWKTILWSTSSIIPTNLLNKENSERSIIDLNLNSDISLEFNIEILNNIKEMKNIQNNNQKLKVHSLYKHFFTSNEVKITKIEELRNINHNSVNNSLNNSINNSVFSEEIGSTLLIEFDISNTLLKYNTADNLSIIPHNSINDILLLTSKELLNYNINEIINIKPIDYNTFHYTFPIPNTLETLLLKYFDINCIIKLNLGLKLLKYITNNNELQYFSNLLLNKNLYKIEIIDKNITLLILILTKLKSLKIPLEIFMNIWPIIQPRVYTISSSSNKLPMNPQITISLVKSIHITSTSSSNGIDEIDKNEFMGLTSRYVKVSFVYC